MLVSRRPGRPGPPATRSYSPSMLFRWMPVPGTMTPSRSRSTTRARRRCPRRRRPRRASSRRAAPARAPRPALDAREPPPRGAASESSRCASPPRWRPTRTRPSRARVCSRITSASAAIASALPAAPLAGPLEQREPVGDQDAARRRRRVRDHLVAAVAGRARVAARRRGTPRGRRGSARRRPPATVLDDRAARARRGRARGAVGGDPLECLGEIGQAERVARREARAVGAAVEAAPLGGVAQDQVEDRVQVRLRRASARRPPRASSIAGCEELGPRQPAVGAVHRLEPGRGARERRTTPRRSGRPASSRCRRRSRRRSRASRRPPAAAPAEAGRGDEEVGDAGPAGRPPGGRARSRPRPGPVSGLSATQAAKAAATQASTALPPSLEDPRPGGSAVSGCPAATAPLMFRAPLPTDAREAHAPIRRIFTVSALTGVQGRAYVSQLNARVMTTRPAPQSARARRGRPLARSPRFPAPARRPRRARRSTRWAAPSAWLAPRRIAGFVARVRLHGRRLAGGARRRRRPDLAARRPPRGSGSASMVNSFAPAKLGDAVKIALCARAVDAPEPALDARRRLRGARGGAVARARARSSSRLGDRRAAALAGVRRCCGVVGALAAVVALFAPACGAIRGVAQLLDGLAALARSPRALAAVVGWTLAHGQLARLAATVAVAAALGLPHPAARGARHPPRPRSRRRPSRSPRAASASAAAPSRSRSRAAASA